MGLLSEFVAFLKEYNVVALAIAFIMGIASTALVKSFVDNIIMPMVTPFIPAGAWENATLAVGPVIVRWGLFVSELLRFVILALVVFMIAKKVLREQKVTKK